MALAGVAAGSDITLDSGKGQSLYDNIPTSGNIGTYTKTERSDGVNVSITFYIEVKDLFGAEVLEDGITYTLDSFSYIGNPNGYYSDRRWILSNGTDSVEFDQTKSSNKYHTTDFTQQVANDPTKQLLTFDKDDILALTLITEGSGQILEVKYYDQEAPGVSFTMINGEVNDGIDHNINPGTTNWKYNSPIVRLTASIPEPTTATLSLLALAGLAVRRRRK